MTHYLVLKPVKLFNGSTLLKKGDKLTPIPNLGGFDVFGKDNKNLFWTDDFLDKHPRLFQRVNND